MLELVGIPEQFAICPATLLAKTYKGVSILVVTRFAILRSPESTAVRFWPS